MYYKLWLLVCVCFQYFINLPDSEVETYLKLFTFMTKREIQDCLANMRVSIFFSITVMVTVKQAFVVYSQKTTVFSCTFTYMYIHAQKVFTLVKCIK